MSDGLMPCAAKLLDLSIRLAVFRIVESRTEMGFLPFVQSPTDVPTFAPTLAPTLFPSIHPAAPVRVCS